jgi:Zn-dependent protease
MIVMNISLALFNMLPVPPLDGSRVLEGLLPLRLQASYQKLYGLAPFLLLGVFFFGGRLIGGPFAYLAGVMRQLIHGIAGFMS